jgi:hypothetical protein
LLFFNICFINDSVILNFTNDISICIVLHVSIYIHAHIIHGYLYVWALSIKWKQIVWTLPPCARRTGAYDCYVYQARLFSMTEHSNSRKWWEYNDSWFTVFASFTGFWDTIGRTDVLATCLLIQGDFQGWKKLINPSNIFSWCLFSYIYINLQIRVCAMYINLCIHPHVYSILKK